MSHAMGSKGARSRVVFMGSPHFAVPSLRALVESSHDVVGVVTQPDRPSGRGRDPVPPDVKKVALEYDLRVLQPETLRHPEVVQQLRELEPDVIVVVAYGEILQPAVLDLPPCGCVNVHPSLLPKYRGPAPVHAALLAGEKSSGVTVMLMDEGMDTGPILAQREIEIRDDDTTGALEKRLAEIGAELLVETLPRWLAGEIEPQLQRDARATYTELISKEEGEIDWELSAQEIWNRVRAYDPWPGTYTYVDGRIFKVLWAEPLPEWSGDAVPGTVVQADQGIAVATGQGALLLKKVQLAGKRAMDVESFARGQRHFIGSRLGEGPSKE